MIEHEVNYHTYEFSQKYMIKLVFFNMIANIFSHIVVLLKFYLSFNTRILAIESSSDTHFQTRGQKCQNCLIAAVVPSHHQMVAIFFILLRNCLLENFHNGLNFLYLE